VIATVFGGSSTAARNAKITELMNLGFDRAPTRATLRRPNPPGAAVAQQAELIAGSSTAATNGGAGKTIRVSGAVSRSLRPMGRPAPEVAEELLIAAIDPAGIALALSSVLDEPVENDSVDAAVSAALVASLLPRARPRDLVTGLVQDVAARPSAQEQLIVTRISTSGGRHWGINVGRYESRYEAERVLLKVALNEMSTLDGALRRVVPRSGDFDANFMGLSREGADLACRRLQARGTMCFMIGNEG
jgi:D-alanyl-D-alanine carboxypeptidase